MKTKDSMQIKVQTLPNGYALTVNGEEFMYFDPVTLLAGFMAHVGLGNSREMEKGSILSVLMSAMMGTAYSDAVETLKQRVAMLSGRYESMIERMDDAVKYVNSAHTQIETMRKTLEQQQNELLGYQQEFLKTKQNNEEMQKRQETVMDMISNSSTLLKAFNETAAQKNKKAAGDEGGEQADKSGEPVKKRGGRPRKNDEDAVTKGNGRRNKAADAQVVKEMLEQETGKTDK